MSDVSAPATPPDDELVTRKILREELANYPTKDDLRQELANYATKDDLRNELERFATKEDLGRFATKEDLERFATKEDLAKLDHKVDTHFGALLDRLLSLESFVRSFARTLPAEFERRARAISEDVRIWVKVVDEKYADLPARVAQLEAQSDE
jgi:hypothetical protein